MASAAMLAMVAGFAMYTRAAQAQDARLSARLDPQTRAAVSVIMDSARARHLPTQPLVDKALEGVGKGADGPRIVTAVRNFAGELGAARAALGASSRDDEIKAGANALHAGVPPAELTRLRAASGRRDVTLALAVTTDLVARKVPVLVASDIVVRLAKAGAHDADLGTFQRNVRLDIESGADPGTAASTRARGALLHASTPPAHRPS